MELQENANEAPAGMRQCKDCTRTSNCLHETSDVILGRNPATRRHACPWCGSDITGNQGECRAEPAAIYSMFECGSMYMINYDTMKVMAILYKTPLCELRHEEETI